MRPDSIGELHVKIRVLASYLVWAIEPQYEGFVPTLRQNNVQMNDETVRISEIDM